MAPPPVGATMSVRVPRSALWWASSRSPATRVGAVAVTVVTRPPVCVTARTAGPPVDTDGEGIDAVAATTAGEAVEPTLVVGDGTDMVADTTDGLAIALAPLVGIVTVKPIRASVTIVPDATKSAALVAAPLASVR